MVSDFVKMMVIYITQWCTGSSYVSHVSNNKNYKFTLCFALVLRVISSRLDRSTGRAVWLLWVWVRESSERSGFCGVWVWRSDGFWLDYKRSPNGKRSLFQWFISLFQKGVYFNGFRWSPNYSGTQTQQKIRTCSVQLRPGAQNENNPQQRAWERGVWDLVFHSYYGNLTRDNVCGWSNGDCVLFGVPCVCW